MRQRAYQAGLIATTSLAAHVTWIPQRSFGTAASSSFTAPHTRSSAPPRHARPVGGRGPVKDRFPPVPTDLADPRRRLAVLVDGSNPNLIPASCTTAEQVYRTSSLFNTVLPAVLQVGVPVLLRVFAHQLPAVWEPLLAGGGGGSSSASANDNVPGGGPGNNISLIRLSPPPTTLPCTSSSTPAVADDSGVTPQLQLEFFRVERFIPVAMQIEADARHIYEFRHMNKVEGVCYVCHEVDRAMYISLMQEQRTGSAQLEGLLREVSHTGQERSVRQQQDPSAAFFSQYVLDELGMAGELLTDTQSQNGV